MPVFQNVMLIVHVFGFFAVSYDHVSALVHPSLRLRQIIVMFWVLAPRNSASVVFTQFTDSGGWSSMGMALMVGQISAIYACICSDAAAHMSEEIKVSPLSDNACSFGTHLLITCLRTPDVPFLRR
jgi:choline transport protein